MEKSGTLFMKADSNCSQIDELSLANFSEEIPRCMRHPCHSARGRVMHGVGLHNCLITNEGPGRLHFVKGTMNSKKNIEIMEKVMFPSVYCLSGDNFIF